jgi:hypothetical protein
MSSKEKIEYNKKMIGKKVLVISKPSYEAIVVDIVDENTFAVQRKLSSKVVHVDIYNVRSLTTQ